MAEKSKSRIRNLSTRYLVFYKWSVSILLVAFVVGFVIREVYVYNNGGDTFIYLPITYGYLVYLWWKANRKVYHVEFDDQFMYVQQKSQDLLIPLENIKDVNLISIGGVYKVDLYSPETFGVKFYFKPSLLYPFNHKKKEAVVDVLWQYIGKAKMKKREFQRNALMS